MYVIQACSDDNPHDTELDSVAFKFCSDLHTRYLSVCQCTNDVENLKFQSWKLNYLNVEAGVVTSLLAHALWILLFLLLCD
jgi:hypothetical protein